MYAIRAFSERQPMTLKDYECFAKSKRISNAKLSISKDKNFPSLVAFYLKQLMDEKPSADIEILHLIYNSCIDGIGEL